VNKSLTCPEAVRVETALELARHRDVVLVQYLHARGSAMLAPQDLLPNARADERYFGRE